MYKFQTELQLNESSVRTLLDEVGNPLIIEQMEKRGIGRVVDLTDGELTEVVESRGFLVLDQEETAIVNDLAFHARLLREFLLQGRDDMAFDIAMSMCGLEVTPPNN